VPPSAPHSDREYPSRPIVGVGAVVLCGDSVLLIRRGHEPLRGEWSIPGGAVELNERLDAAVAREVLEETGVEVEVGSIVEVVDRIRPDLDAGRPQFHYVLVDFLCRPASAAEGAARTPLPLATASSDADEARWVRIESLAHYAVAAATMRVIHKAIEIARSGPWAAHRGYSHLE